MNEVFVIEKMLCAGIWELFSPTFYTTEIEALDACVELRNHMLKHDDKFCARVTKLVAKNT